MATTNEARVVVLMPVFNSMPYLEEAVASLQAQTFANFRLVAIDDGSTDGTVEYLRSVDDARLHVIADGVHRGLGGALNHALAGASGEFIARMDGDDLCSPERLALQLAFLEQNHAVGAVGTQFTYFGNTGRTGFARPLPLCHDEIWRDLNGGQLALIHASLMMRTELIKAIGGYRFRGIGEDWDMFLRLGETTLLANIPQRCYYYRVHGRNASALQYRLTRERISYACYCAKARRSGAPEPTEEAHRAQANRGRLARWQRTLDEISLASYFNGRRDVLNGRPVAGYCKLLLGGAIGPWRIVARLSSWGKSVLRTRNRLGP